MLTKKQHQLLTLIEERLSNTGVAPSYDEMRDLLGLKSKSGIHRLVVSLEERGFIRRLAHKARAIEVVRLPEDRFDIHAQDVVVSKGHYAPKPIKRGTKSPKAVNDGQPAAVFFPPGSYVEAAQPASAVSLPLPGKIAAGTPISALSDTSTFIDVPTTLIGGSGEHFALTVEGDSMIEAGILDGDIAIIRRGSSANNGDVVVALVDREEATLKRLQKQGNTVALEPANRHYKTMRYGAERVEIQGRLVGLMRTCH